jgi:hypothetical protein
LYNAAEAGFTGLQDAGRALENGDAMKARLIADTVRRQLEADLASFGRSSPSDVSGSGFLGPLLVESIVREAALAAIAAPRAGETPTVSFPVGLDQAEAALTLARDELKRLRSTTAFKCATEGPGSTR